MRQSLLVCHSPAFYLDTRKFGLSGQTGELSPIRRVSAFCFEPRVLNRGGALGKMKGTKKTQRPPTTVLFSCSKSQVLSNKQWLGPWCWYPVFLLDDDKMAVVERNTEALSCMRGRICVAGLCFDMVCSGAQIDWMAEKPARGPRDKLELPRLSMTP